MPAFPLPDPELHDDLIRLRPPVDADVPDITMACQDELTQRFTFVPGPYTEDDARWWVATAPEHRAAGEALSLVIADPTSGRYLGSVGLLRPRWEHRAVEIGYAVAPWARGGGRATRAAGLLSRWALRDLRFARVDADIDIENPGSHRVIERAGFQREGVRRSLIEAKGRRWTLVSYSLLPEDLG